MSRPSRPAPRSFSDDWPDAPCSDEVAEIARRFAVNIKAITDQRGIREIGRAAQMDHSSLSRIINGETWADTATLARLELALAAELWPRLTNSPSGRQRENGSIGSH